MSPSGIIFELDGASLINLYTILASSRNVQYSSIGYEHFMCISISSVHKHLILVTIISFY